jgi:hypothetical protein
VAVLKIINQTINNMIGSKEHQWNEAIAYEAVIRMIDDKDTCEISVGR